MQIPGFWAIVPAGGAGTRLWPLSRRRSPKFLHDLTGSGRTLLQQTWDRLSPIAADRIVVVTGRDHAPEVARQLPALPAAYLLAEPSPRDSMPAIAWAAAVVAARDPEAVIGSFAADHVISRLDGFHAAVGEAVALARTGLLVTLGITPTYAATGFGYIRAGMPLGVEGAPSGRAVVEFVEKPDADRAEAYLASGEFRWNAGMFVVKASVLLSLVEQWHPTMAAGVRALAADGGRLDEVWPTLTKIAIDHAVAEPAAAAGRVAVVPATFGWDDVGDFDSLAGLLEAQTASAASPAAAGVSLIGDPADLVTVDSSGLVVSHSGRLVALIGVEDLVVVDTPGALLVVPRARAQEVKAVVDRLTAMGRDDLR
jgi:mannose-1-phosphate guanylyltransferase